MLGVLGYVLLAALIGASTALLQADPFEPTDNGLLLFSLIVLAGLAAAFAGRRFFLSLATDQHSFVALAKPGLLIILVWALTIMACQAALMADLPTASGVSAGLAYGLAMFALWLERKPSVERARIAVYLLYGACALTAVAALMGFIPASAFWVVSAVIPSWQAGRLAAQHHQAAAFRLLTAAIRIFAWVLTVGLAAPALLFYR